MASTKDDRRLNSPTARKKLETRHAPYWLVLEKGRALGYRKGLNGGQWLARFYDPTATPPKVSRSLGAADDSSDADGVMVLNFSQAQTAAREWFKVAFHEATGERVRTGPYTVTQAIDDYLEDRKRHGAKTASRMKGDLYARVIPSLGDQAVEKLTKKRLETWLEDLAKSPARHRGKEGKAPETEDEVRKRRETANRIWKNFRAALNLAVKERKAPTDAGWKNVKAFKGTTAPRIRFLSISEQIRLVNAAPSADFRRLLQAGLFTGAREGELVRLRARDFTEMEGNGTIFIETSKSGKSRHITVTPEGVPFFRELVIGLKGEDPIFPRTNYDRKDKRNIGGWSRAEISRMMTEVCTAAELTRMVFHELRHTYASTMLNHGLPLVFLAQQLGHRDTRMVERHYGHLCQTAKAEAVRKLAPVLGIVAPSNVAALKIPGGA